MSRYLLVKPGHPVSHNIVLDAETYVIVLPDDVDPWTYDVPNAADDTRAAIIPLIEHLEFEEPKFDSVSYWHHDV